MPPGRPRAFDTDVALSAAMHLFWRRGYEGVSMAALARGMGINLPSLYGAFGNKRELFGRVLTRYIEQPASYLKLAIEQPTAGQVARRALAGAIEMAAHPDNAKGCLLVHGALATGPASDGVREHLAQVRQKAEEAVRARLQRAWADGDLPPEADPAALAGYLMTVIWGLSVQAAGGATPERLHQAAAMALLAWPE